MSGFENTPDRANSETVLSARRSAAIALIGVRKRLGEPVSDEILSFASGETNAYVDPRSEDEIRTEAVASARQSAARALIEVDNRLGEISSDEVRQAAELDG